MTKLLYQGFFLLMAGPSSVVTASAPAVPSGGLRVREHPPALNVTRGDTATLTCHFNVDSDKYGVQWFRKLDPERPISNSSRRFLLEKKNQTSSLVIHEVSLEDAGWYYCQVNVLMRDPETGNGTELLVLASPSAPRIFLQVPTNPQEDQWALLCITGGFHPSRLTLTWTYQTDAGIDRPSVVNCTLPSINHPVDLLVGLVPGVPAMSERQAAPVLNSTTSRYPPECFQLMDKHSREVYLVSVLPLPPKRSLDAGMAYVCSVHDHPALNATLSAAPFTWDASPNEVIAYLNILKMCFLSAVTMVFLLEGLKRLCMRKKRSHLYNKP